MNERLWRTRDVMTFLGRSERALRALVRSNRFPAPFRIRGGRVLYWNPATVRSWASSLEEVKS